MTQDVKAIVSKLTPKAKELFVELLDGVTRWGVSVPSNILDEWATLGLTSINATPLGLAVREHLLSNREGSDHV